MSEYTDNSRIEAFRLRRHGKDTFVRFLKDNGTTGYTANATTLTKRFLIVRKFDTAVGARVERLVFDIPPNWNMTILTEAIFVDLVKADLTYKRYRISSETTPSIISNRVRVGVTAAFNDTTPIV